MYTPLRAYRIDGSPRGPRPPSVRAMTGRSRCGLVFVPPGRAVPLAAPGGA